MRTIRWVLVVVIAAFVLLAAGPAQAADDSPASDDGGDSTSEPTEEPEPEPTSESTSEPTQAPKPTADPTADGSRGSSGKSDDHDSDSKTDSDDSSHVTGTGPTNASPPEPSVPPADDESGRTDDVRESAGGTTWNSALGWVLLVGGLTSGVGAVVIYRRNPGLISLPWLGHAH